ncbi:MAG: hypothetical protein JWQ19_2851 [Subtercola sp.]|nr:hypothetical protein [Subtercola sp.]
MIVIVRTFTEYLAANRIDSGYPGVDRARGGNLRLGRITRFSADELESLMRDLKKLDRRSSTLGDEMSCHSNKLSHIHILASTGRLPLWLSRTRIRFLTSGP